MFNSSPRLKPFSHLAPSVLSTVKNLKENGEDFEFYPTTKAMLATVKEDIQRLMAKDFRRNNEGEIFASVLDVGAGNGSSLELLTCGDRYAIEKSQLLVDGLQKDIVVVGTDFKQCTLIDKKVDVVFCNPPYSEYEQWMDKVIREASSLLIYFVVPSRWEASLLVKESLRARNSHFKVLETTDFLLADRKARAKVDIVRIDMASLEKRSNNRYGLSDKPDVDPFGVWFDREFPFKVDTAINCDLGEGETLKEKVGNKLVPGSGLINALTELYDLEMGRLWETYKLIAAVDPAVLQEIDVSVENIKCFMENKIAGLKRKYWYEFFDNYASITDRLTSSSRKKLLERIHGNVSVDFTPSNAYAITSWVIKNANGYFDSQLIHIFEDMTDKASVIKYVSNRRVFKEDKYQYNRLSHEDLGAVALDYRIVVSKGGIADPEAWGSNKINGLDISAHDFINNLIIIGKNLGYSFASWQSASHAGEWTSGNSKEFRAEKNGEDVIFMTVRAYKNGNLHFKFNTGFMKKLNVIHGKLKGWIKDGKDVEREFNFSGKHRASKVTAEEAREVLSAGNYHLLPSSASKLLLGRPSRKKQTT